MKFAKLEIVGFSKIVFTLSFTFNLSYISKLKLIAESESPPSSKMLDLVLSSFKCKTFLNIS